MLGYYYFKQICEFNKLISKRIDTLFNLINRGHEQINKMNELRNTFNYSLEINILSPNFYQNLEIQKRQHKHILNQLKKCYDMVKDYIEDDLESKTLLCINELKFGLNYSPIFIVKKNKSKLNCPVCRQCREYAKTIEDLNDLCPICLSEDREEKVCKMNSCNHHFHVKCIQTYAMHNNIKLPIIN